MTKIAILFTNYGPYHLARLSCFQKHCERLGWNVVGIELTRSGVEYEWKTQLEKFPGSIISVLGEQSLEQVKFTHLLQILSKILSQINPDVVAIAGYFRPAMLAVLLWCLWNKKSPILLSESKEDDAHRDWFKETAKSFLIKRYQAALVAGKPHKRYLNQLRMSTNAIFCGYDVVDNDVFHPSKIRCLSPPLNRPYFLTINRFIEKKNLPFLLSSYAAYRQQAGSHAWDLILCGDGELRPDLEKRITELNLQDFVHQPGFLQQNELLPYFAHAQCFIHTSTTEQWGLVVNEAMASGLPVLVSNCCGCAPDLIQNGRNGYTFDPYDVDELATLMLKIPSEECDRIAMCHASQEIITHWSPQTFAENLQKAIETALATPRRQASPFD